MAELPLSTPVKQWGLLSWNKRWMTYDGVTIKYAHKSPSLILRASAALDTPRCRVFAPRAGLIPELCVAQALQVGGGAGARRRAHRGVRSDRPRMQCGARPPNATLVAL